VLFYVFLCCSSYCLFCVVLCIVCVYMCTELLPPGGYPIQLNISHLALRISGVILPPPLQLLHGVHTDYFTINEVFSNSNYTASLHNLKYYPDIAQRCLVFAVSEPNSLAYVAGAPAAGLGCSVTKVVNSDAMVNEANRYNCISSHHTHNYTTLHA
jgi:hypothetical protein